MDSCAPQALWAVSFPRFCPKKALGLGLVLWCFCLEILSDFLRRSSAFLFLWGPAKYLVLSN